MELHKENPYANGRIIVFDDNTAVLERELETFEITKNSRYVKHIVKDGEFLDEICKKYYPQAHHPEWYSLKIADFNNIDNPLDVQSYEGRELIIPLDLL